MKHEGRSVIRLGDKTDMYRKPTKSGLSRWPPTCEQSEGLERWRGSCCRSGTTAAPHIDWADDASTLRA